MYSENQETSVDHINNLKECERPKTVSFTYIRPRKYLSPVEINEYYAPKSGLFISIPKFSFCKSKKKNCFDNTISLSKTIPGCGEYKINFPKSHQNIKFLKGKKISFLEKEALSKKNQPGPAHYKYKIKIDKPLLTNFK